MNIEQRSLLSASRFDSGYLGYWLVTFLYLRDRFDTVTQAYLHEEYY